jgi:hypothetical protein
MRHATMSASYTAWFYRYKKGKYRRRTDVRMSRNSKPIKGKYRK